MPYDISEAALVGWLLVCHVLVSVVSDPPASLTNAAFCCSGYTMPIEKQDGARLIKAGLSFTILPNKSIEAIQDPVALAIWAHLTSKPPDWIIRKAELMARFGLGRERYTKAMQELRKLGLVWDFTVRNGEGQITDNAIVCSSMPDLEAAQNHRNVRKPTLRGKPHSGKTRSPGKPTPLLSKDLSYKENITYKNKSALPREKVSSTMDQLTDTSWAKGLIEG
jgi:hypothetical protein